MAMTLVLPGSAQLVMGNKTVGRIAVRTWLGLLALGAVAVLLAFIWRGGLISLATNPRILFLLRLGLLAGAVGWALLLVDAWRISRPLEMARTQRLWMTGLNGTLVMTTAGVMLFAAHLVGVQQSFIGTVFASQTVTQPHDGRYNLLLLGGDSGSGREGMRPDSITVASIDADTGKTVLIGIPRNLQDVPFPRGSVMARQFPHGFNCDGCEINGVSTWATDHRTLFDTKDPGITATVGAVEATTGLEINYYALVNLEGFASLVDAVGGVTIDVKERTAIGGIGAPISGWIEPGTRRLNGHDALWYARSRVENDDWSRMGRQKCVMHAMLEQLSPKTVLLNAQKVAESGAAVLTTNIPGSDVDTFADLALKARTQKVSTVSLVPPVIYTGNPDFRKVRRLIGDAVDTAEGHRPVRFATSMLALPNAHDDPRRANQTTDLAADC
jgi:LCP family protein required for cell wall assembly